MTLNSKEEGLPDYLQLRKRQNNRWALTMVDQGLSLEAESEFQAAIKKYNAAMDMDEECNEAYAAKANLCDLPIVGILKFIY
jgi:hypothetical protein